MTIVSVDTNIVNQLVSTKTIFVRQSMKLTATEKLNFAIIRGGKAYAEWDRQHGMPSYLTIILYELLMRQRLTQKDLVNLSDLPKQLAGNT